MNTKLKTVKIMKNSMINLKKCFYRAFAFEAFFKLISFIFIIPATMFMFKLLTRVLGLKAIINGDFFKFITKIRGLLSIIIIGLFASLIILLEFGGLTSLSLQSHSTDEISILKALKTSCSKLKNLLNPSALILVLYIMIILPFINIGLNSSVIKSLSIPKFVMDSLYSHPIYTVLYFIFIIALYYLSIRLIFSIHLILSNNLSVSQAMKESIKITRKRVMKISWILLSWKLILLFITIIIPLAILGLIFLILRELSFNVSGIINIMVPLISFGNEAFLIISIAYVPSNIMLLTEIFNELHPIEYSYLSQDKIYKSKYSLEKKFFRFIKKNKSILLIISTIALALTTAYTASNIKKVLYPSKIEVIAHRGYSFKAPENSISSVKSAIDAGADIVEIDVQETKDGEIVLAHDKTLKRLTGINKSLNELTYNELDAIDIGNSFSKDFSGEKIPKLEEIINITKGKVKLLIELKSYDNNWDSLSEKVVKLIERYNLEDSCLIHSLNYDSIKKVKSLNANIKVGYIVYAALGDLNSMDNVDFYSLEQSIITDKIVRNLHLKNKKVYVWTLNEEEDIYNVMNYNIDGLITDDPTLAKGLYTDSFNYVDNLLRLIN